MNFTTIWEAFFMRYSKVRSNALGYAIRLTTMRMHGFVLRNHLITFATFKFGVSMNFRIEYEQEEDGRWLAEVPELPGVLAYGTNAEEAMLKVEALALRIIAERLEQGESRPIPIHFSLAATA